MSAWTSGVELHTHDHRDGLSPRGLEDSDVAQCGTCLRKWCHTCNPTPSARCPFEYDHEDDEPAYFGEDSHDDADDLDDVVDAVREHSGDYIAMVEGLVEELRALRARLGGVA